MTLTFEQARDSMLEQVTTAWAATGNPLVYDDLAGSVPKTAVPWARVTVSHNTGGQATLANHSGQARWRREGVVTIQVFTPTGQGLTAADGLVQTVVNALEGVALDGGLWFRNVRVNEIGSDDSAWFQVNVIADFQYEEVK